MRLISNIKFSGLIIIFCFLTVVSFAKDEKSDLQWYKDGGSRSAEWDDLVISGIQAYDAGTKATGYILMKKAFDKGCRDPLVLFKIGIYEEQRGKYREAVVYFVNASDNFPKFYASHEEAKKIDAHAARAAFMANDYLTALKYANNAISTNNYDITTLLIAAQIYGVNKDWANSIRILQKAREILLQTPQSVERDVQFISVMRLLITSLMNANEIEKAETAINELLYLIPNDPLANQYKSDIERQKNKKREDEAIRRLIE